MTIITKLKNNKLVLILLATLLVVGAGICTIVYLNTENYKYKKCVKAFENGEWQIVVDTYNSIDWPNKYTDPRRAETAKLATESYYHLGQYQEGITTINRTSEMTERAYKRHIQPWIIERQLFGDLQEIIPQDYVAVAHYYSGTDKAEQMMSLFFEKEAWSAVFALSRHEDGYYYYIALRHPEAFESPLPTRRASISGFLRNDLKPEYALEYGDAALITTADTDLATRVSKASEAYNLALNTYPERENEIRMRLKYVDMLQQEVDNYPSEEMPIIFIGYAPEYVRYHVGRKDPNVPGRYTSYMLPPDHSAGILGSYIGDIHAYNVYVGRIRQNFRGAGSYHPALEDSCLMFEIDPARGIYNVKEIEGASIEWKTN